MSNTNHVDWIGECCWCHQEVEIFNHNDSNCEAMMGATE